MKYFLIITVIWIIGIIWLLPQDTNTTNWLGKKVDELKQSVTEGQVQGEKVLNNNQSLVRVVKSIDGDTIEIENGLKVRLIGINTPETVDPRRPLQCFGQEAKEFTKSLVEGKTVRLEKDVSETDKFGRLLRYVYIQNPDGTETFLNLKLVEEGFAESSSYPPDISYQDKFLAAQNQAVLEARGLWGKCGSIPHSTSTKKKS